MQRRIDLAVMSDEQLREMLARYLALTGLAREVGTTSEMMARWREMCLEIELELALRKDPLAS